MNKAKSKETFGKALFGITAVICIIAVIAIFAFLIIKSVPAFNKLGIFDFVFGDNWSPDRNDTFDTENISGSYGIFSMIVGTLAATVGALLFGGVLGYFTAVFIVFFCPKRLKRIFFHSFILRQNPWVKMYLMLINGITWINCIIRDGR